MTSKELLEFVNKEMMEAGETLARDPEESGPFAVALIELPAGGYVIRVAQPAVILHNKPTKLDPIYTIGPWGVNAFPAAARRFNKLVDEDLA